MRKSGIGPAIAMTVIGVVLMTVMVVSMRRSGWPFPQDAASQDGSNQAAAAVNGDTSTAMRYVRALQQGNCDEAIALTLWMRDRIEQIQLQQPDRVADIREQLCRSLTDRRIEGNRLTEEGMEDQYVIAPGTEVTVVGMDAGRPDLERPVAVRVWANVTYPRYERAPLNLDGKPIRSLTAGISASADKYILKAAVIGNLEIDFESIDTHWDEHGGTE